MSRLLSAGRCACLILFMFLIPAVSMAKIRPPLAASLDLITTPTAGGHGVAVWTGIPSITPESAIIQFILEQPGAARPTVTTQSLTLQAGRTAGTSTTFATPGPGIYQLTAAVTLNVKGGRFAWTRLLRINVPKTGPAVLEPQKPVATPDIILQPEGKAVQPQQTGPLSYSPTGPFTISGTLKYTDKTYNSSQYTGTAALPIRRAQVQIRDAQGSDSRLLATTRTDASGNFSCALSGNSDGDGTGYDLFIRVVADQPEECRVEKLNDKGYYVVCMFSSSTVKNWGGGNLSLGTLTVPLTDSGAWNIFDCIITGYDKVKSLGATPPKVTVDWPLIDPKVTTYYDSGMRTIYLQSTSDDPDEFDDSVILHEYGHHISFSLSYDKSIGGEHYWSEPSMSAALAWSEGWATFFSSAVRGRNYYFDSSAAGGMSINLELPTDNPRGEYCEGAVAASLWDVFDTANDKSDMLSDGLSHTWAIFRSFNSSSQCVVRDYYNGWVKAGYPSLAAVQAILNEHGINYGWTLAPAVSSLKINGGTAYTIKRAVTLNNSCTGSPAYYMASESSSFTGATWKAYGTAPAYTITGAGDGVKKVYFKIKSANGVVSNVISDTIQLIEKLPVVNTFAINGGASTASSRSVKLNNSCGGTPAYYMASQSSAFTGAAWLAWSTAPAFTLSAGNGVKTVYFKVKDAAGRVSAVKSDSITLNEPLSVASFAIKNGAASTNTRAVTLNNTCTGSPAYYMVSERSDFSGAVWKAWSAAPAYTITGAGNGTKTLYFKVKNAAGVQSAVKTDAITLDAINGILTLGGAAVTSTISPAKDYDWIKFSITTAGPYTIETFAGTLTDNYIRLYGPNSMTTLITQDNDSGAGAMAKITVTLNPGTYYIKAQAYAATATGTFTTKLTSMAAPVITSFRINNGDAQTFSRTVKLNNVCTGAPAYYMASESSAFTGAAWKAWTSAPAFTLSAGNGGKTVYFKVKDAAGRVSAVKSDAITVMETFAIDVDGGEYGGNIINSTDFNLFEFEVVSPGWYSIKTYPSDQSGALTDAVIYLYDENGNELRKADDQGSIAMPMISEYLNAGVYTVWVEGYGTSNFGRYSIEVKSGSAYKPLTMNGSSVAGNITWADDVNWFTFNVTTTGTCTIESNKGSLTDARMFLYRQVEDQDGVVLDEMLTMNDDEDPGVFAFNGMPWISTVLVPGTYYVSMENYDGSQTGTYSVKVRGGKADVHFTTLIDNWEWTPDSITDATVGAYYTFYVPSTGTYTITSYQGTLFKGQMWLYDPVEVVKDPAQSQAIAADYSDTEEVYMPEITVKLAKGTYYVWFSGYSDADLGTYGIELLRANAKPAAKVGRPAAPKPTMKATH